MNGINFSRDEVSSGREFVEFTRLAKHFSCGQLFLIEKKKKKSKIGGKLVKIAIFILRRYKTLVYSIRDYYPLNLLLQIFPIYPVDQSIKKKKKRKKLTA